MLKTILLSCLLATSLCAGANTVLVKNMEALKKANREAMPGDIIVLQNGEWKNADMALSCKGTAEKPITFKAETAGRVFITGNSKLELGGSFIIVDGFYFTRGYAGDDAVINFRISKNQLANNCRVTNTVINDFNNAKRMEENYWVSFSGKNNRVDHCSFLNKKNMGVLMAVILDDDRSRENFHSIDHNYFGLRLPLASNSGEIIRVGVSQHCEFNSNTQITDNFFEHCDGETEIISIKSCSNVVRGNLFKECQGSVVLRHGNYNVVESNVFLGNDKEGTGGVRVINRGQWVVNNLFYKCRGEWFRSPLSIMNGVPNSPAFRYVAVTEAVIANNSFVECTPIGIGIGSDTERSVPPKDVQFLNNIFYNHRDPVVYTAYDVTGGISFWGNLVSNEVKQNMVGGFRRSALGSTKPAGALIPLGSSAAKSPAFDSLYATGKTKLANNLSPLPGFADGKLLTSIESNAKNDCGAGWLTDAGQTPVSRTANCETAAAIMEQLKKNDGTRLTINLTGTTYHFTEALFITQDVIFTGSQKTPVTFMYSAPSFLLQVKAGNTLTVRNINLDLSAVHDFISTDTSGSSNHSSFAFSNAVFSNLGGTFFTAARSSVADSILVSNCTFSNNKKSLFNFSNETGNKGYYNVEVLKLSNNRFLNGGGQILNMLRGGNDESTMGPYLVFTKNTVANYLSADEDALFFLSGTQRSLVEKNNFTNCNKGKILLQYDDRVRAVHILKDNSILGSGIISSNKFVRSVNNVMR